MQVATYLTDHPVIGHKTLSDLLLHEGFNRCEISDIVNRFHTAYHAFVLMKFERRGVPDFIEPEILRQGFDLEHELGSLPAEITAYLREQNTFFEVLERRVREQNCVAEPVIEGKKVTPEDYQTAVKLFYGELIQKALGNSRKNEHVKKIGELIGLFLTYVEEYASNMNDALGGWSNFSLVLLEPQSIDNDTGKLVKFNRSLIQQASKYLREVYGLMQSAGIKGYENPEKKWRDALNYFDTSPFCLEIVGRDFTFR